MLNNMIKTSNDIADDTTVTQTRVQQSSQQSLDKKEAAKLKAEQRQQVHNLVVKIINWRSDVKLKPTSKITSKEWKKYCEHTYTIATPENVLKAKEKLKEVRGMIQKQGGFES